jgi:hypothetical protein
MWHAWLRREIHTIVWWGNLEGADHVEEVGCIGL